jgi:aldehyde:ferredoxin oxidoreductase
VPEHYGYAGRILQIDLCSKSISEYPWSDAQRAETLGGKIMAAQILRDHLTGKETAFSAENQIVIATGPLTGTGAPGSARFDLAALSPKDDLPAFSNCGGDFGVRLKRAGYDALILTGRSKETCWLEITEKQVLFHDAAHLWGTGTGQCQAKLAEMLAASDFGVLCIGPAGENLVKFATVISEGHSAGRAGIGAVFGWKHVKAITVSGGGPIPLYDPGAAAVQNRNWYAQLQSFSREEGGCRGCPLHCSKHAHAEGGSVFNELGMDSIAAKDAAAWAAEKGISIQSIYEDMAFRRGIGSVLADEVPKRKHKSGMRRGESYDVIRKAFHLSSEDPETEGFCRALTEAISAAGQCMFTVKGLPEQSAAEKNLPVLTMLSLVTGMEMDWERFLQAGYRFHDLQQQLNQICSKKDR